MLPASARLNVRRLAALDMHGSRGTRRRRCLILGEFALGTVGGAALGVATLTVGGAVGDATTTIIGVWLLGVAANYVPLTWHVLALWRPGELSGELAGIDLRGELREYTRAQVWVLVPFWVAGLAVVQSRRFG